MNGTKVESKESSQQGDASDDGGHGGVPRRDRVQDCDGSLIVAGEQYTPAAPERTKFGTGELDRAQLLPVDVPGAYELGPRTRVHVDTVVEAEAVIGGVREGDDIRVGNPAGDTVPASKKSSPPLQISPNVAR